MPGSGTACFIIGALAYAGTLARSTTAHALLGVFALEAVLVGFVSLQPARLRSCSQPSRRPASPSALRSSPSPQDGFADCRPCLFAGLLPTTSLFSCSASSAAAGCRPVGPRNLRPPGRAALQLPHSPRRAHDPESVGRPTARVRPRRLRLLHAVACRRMPSHAVACCRMPSHALTCARLLSRARGCSCVLSQALACWQASACPRSVASECSRSLQQNAILTSCGNCNRDLAAWARGLPRCQAGCGRAPPVTLQAVAGCRIVDRRRPPPIVDGHRHRPVGH